MQSMRCSVRATLNIERSCEPAEPAYRSNNALIAHGEAIVLPSDTTAVQYEGELVVVIASGQTLERRECLSCVLGYTIGNDISERNWQKIDRTFWRSKNSDHFKPWARDRDGHRARVAAHHRRVNGETQIQFATNDMLFGVARFIATITQYSTLHPGDVIWMGTEGASGT